jgi:hypothetical protein
MILSRLAKSLFAIVLITASASTFAITLLCTPETLGGWNTAMQNKGQKFPDTCREFRQLYPQNFGCSAISFDYEPSSNFARVNQTTYKLLSSTSSEYEFQKADVTGFKNDGPLYSVSEEAKIKIDRRSLYYTYTHGTALKIAPKRFNSSLMLESGICKVVETTQEEAIF